METPRKFVHNKNLPPRIPVTTAVVTWLALDRLNAPEWLYGAFGVILAVFTLVNIILIVKSDYVDIFKDKH